MLLIETNDFSIKSFNFDFHFRDQPSGWYLESLERLVIVHHDPTKLDRTSMTLPSKKTIKNSKEFQQRMPTNKTLPRQEKSSKNISNFSKNFSKTQTDKSLHLKPSSQTFNRTPTRKSERQNIKSATWTKSRLNDFEKVREQTRSKEDSKVKQSQKEKEFNKKEIQSDTMKRSNVQRSQSNKLQTSSQTKTFGRDSKGKGFDEKQKTDFQRKAIDLHAPLSRNVEEKKSKTDLLANPKTHLLANPKTDLSDHNLNKQKECLESRHSDEIDGLKRDKKSNAIGDGKDELLHSQSKPIQKVKAIVHPTELHPFTDNDHDHDEKTKIASSKENSNLQNHKLEDSSIHDSAPSKTIADETLLKQTKSKTTEKQSSKIPKSSTSENLTKAWVYNEGLLGNGEKWTGQRENGVRHPFDRDVTQRNDDVIGRRNRNRRRRDEGVRYWTFKNQNNKVDKAMDFWTCLFCCCS